MPLRKPLAHLTGLIEPGGESFLPAVFRPALKKPRETVWQGPDVDGVTYSLLSRFLGCRERFRLLVVEGLKPVETFSHKIEYGSMWHVCEEVLAKDGDWELALKLYASTLCRTYRTQQAEVEHWYNVCKTQFPIYIDYWKNSKAGIKPSKPVVQEFTFDAPCYLPSGRRVRLRGKWDAVEQSEEGLYLVENKTKGQINERQIKRQLSFDLQTMIYMVALYLSPCTVSRVAINGVRYNVVRRPLSGGKGSIVRHKATKNRAEETQEDYYRRLGDIIRAEPETYFMRWQVEVTPGDVLRFRRECLDPILEQLCDWWEWVLSYRGESPFLSKFDSRNDMHWRHPYGVWNPLDNGAESDLDEYLNSGSEVGLTRTGNLFKELG